MRKSIIFLSSLVLSLGLVATALSDQVEPPVAFSNGETADAEDVNQNFQRIYDQVNKIGKGITVDEPSGNVGIGKAPSPTSGRLQVDGSVSVQGSISGFGVVPIGSISAWHKQAIAGGLTLPEGWAECNGQTVSVPQNSLLDPDGDGQYTMPELNEKYRNYHSKGVFLRGSVESGRFENDAFQSHKHYPGVEGHGEVTTYSFLSGLGSGTGNSDGWNFKPTDLSVESPRDYANDSVRVSEETRPVNYSVVWIMRIK